jgi:hypothetical protein
MTYLDDPRTYLEPDPAGGWLHTLASGAAVAAFVLAVAVVLCGVVA